MKRLPPDDAARFDKAMDLQRAGKLARARPIFARLVVKYPDDAWSVGMLGGTLLRMNRLAEAEPHLRRATQLRPKWDLASFGLISCLWESNKRPAAVREMRRILDAAANPRAVKGLMSLIAKDLGVKPAARKRAAARKRSTRRA